MTELCSLLKDFRSFEYIRKAWLLRMVNFIYSNISTIIIGIVLAAIVGMVIVKMIRDKKKGKSSCGGSCAGCPSNCDCHQKK